MPLEMSEQTLPTIPKPPEDLRADAISTSSVQLRWNPKYPPNGKISVFTVRIGTNVSEEESVTTTTKFDLRMRYPDISTTILFQLAAKQL